MTAWFDKIVNLRGFFTNNVKNQYLALKYHIHSLNIKYEMQETDALY